MKKLALISVYDKTGITDFAMKLLNYGYDFVSTGGTYKVLKGKGIPVMPVEDLTGFPEVLNGRVKTLHPKIFSGILADRMNPDHINEIKKFELALFDLIVVSLYPFEETTKKKGAVMNDIIEEIDIGGVSLIRAAAKNFENTTALVDISQYDIFIELLEKFGNDIPAEYSRLFAARAFECIANYDYVISEYFRGLADEVSLDSEIKNKYFPQKSKFIKLSNPQKIRYGENPDQAAVLYKTNFDEIFEVLHGKEISYNNLLDINAAVELINEFENDEPACAIVKHGNPCGVAIRPDLTSAYLKAYETDKSSPFGGIIVFNKKLDLKTSIEVDKLFSEIVIASDFEVDAFELLKKKKNRRLIKYSFYRDKDEYKSISGGVLFQKKQEKLFDDKSFNVVSDIKPTSSQIEDMKFALKIVKHTKSNAVVFVKDKGTLGIGGGQPSRVDSTKIAIMKSEQNNLSLTDSVVASDAFFPFADSISEISKSGSKAIIQPGGSIRDNEVIDAVNVNKMTMVFTGIRYFKH